MWIVGKMDEGWDGLDMGYSDVGMEIKEEGEEKGLLGAG